MHLSFRAHQQSHTVSIIIIIIIIEMFTMIFFFNSIKFASSSWQFQLISFRKNKLIRSRSIHSKRINNKSVYYKVWTTEIQIRHKSTCKWDIIDCIWMNKRKIKTKTNGFSYTKKDKKYLLLKPQLQNESMIQNEKKM